MTIISLSGLIGSGKDTVAEQLITKYGFTRMSFADTLKDAVATVFGWDREMVEGRTPAARQWREQVDPWWAKRLGVPELTPRWVLQFWGTEVCRNGFHDDIWIASLERKLMNCADQNIVVSDSRFINELSMLANAGAVTVSVIRGDRPKWWDTAVAAQHDAGSEKSMHMLGIHRSEWDWAGYEFDVTLRNNGTLEQLHHAVDNLMNR